VRVSSTGRFSQLVDEARAASLEEVRPGDEARVFYRLSVPKKVLVMMGGPLMNLLIGVVLLTFVVTVHGVATAQPGAVVASVSQCVVPVTEVDGVGTWPAGPVAQALADGRLHSPPRTQLQWLESPTVLFIDNYDSFVYNLVQYVRELGAHADVVRNDAVSVDELADAAGRGDFSHLVVSPGPGAPADAGISVELIARLGPTVPTLGVCLGHQAIGEAYGAAVVRAPEIIHGKPSLVHHDGQRVYAGLPSPLTCARYHSLIIDEATLPPELSVTARTASGIVMGVRHATHPVEGVQMHPESILTTHGHDMLTNFLSRLG
jgi:para-aminobenzoate synthetase/4-amino-4-deoxychorismate lyase